MNKRIVLIGGGGHCQSVLDSLIASNEYTDIAIVDKKYNNGGYVFDIPIIGSDEDLPGIFADGYKYAFVTVGSIGDSSLRIKLFNVINEIGFTIPNVIDPSSIVSRYSKLEDGIFVGKRAVINAGSIIGKGSIINTGSIIEHGCHIGEFTHIAPGSVLGGEVRVGAYTHIGMNCVIKQQIIIGSGSIIGMGSNVLENVDNEVIAYGNPCREVSKR